MEHQNLEKAPGDRGDMEEIWRNKRNFSYPREYRKPKTWYSATVSDIDDVEKMIAEGSRDDDTVSDLGDNRRSPTGKLQISLAIARR